MIKAIDEFLVQDVRFHSKVKDEEYFIYSFIESGLVYKLTIEKEFDHEKWFITNIYSENGSFDSYWDFPEWLKDIEVKTNHMFFKFNRLRYLSKGVKVPFQNIIFYSSYSMDCDYKFWDNFTDNDFDDPKCYNVHSEYYSILKNSIPLLEEYGYEFILFDLNEEECKFYIKPIEEGNNHEVI